MFHISTAHTHSFRMTHIVLIFLIFMTVIFTQSSLADDFRQADGYRGIWYGNQPSGDEYKFKYSGGLGTYTAKHIPLAYYAPEVNKTFFCWGGTARDENRLLLMVSQYDHTTGMVPRPTVLIDKQTDDAHDNPTIMLDDKGHVWIFVSAHGTVRPSYIYRSTEPYSTGSFDLISETNFSYPQPWHVDGKGFIFLHTRYLGGRFLYWITSPDGVTWSEPKQLASIKQGHYQISGRHEGRIGTAFNYHPETLNSNWADPTVDSGSGARLNGLNYRTNLYYLQTDDFGETWKTVDGKTVETPLTEIRNEALIHDFENEGLLAYMKDLSFDNYGNPVILFITSKGYQAGPGNAPRTWRTAHWTGKEWHIRPVTVSDNNYDMGSLYIEPDGTWRIIGPTETGPQQYNPGGEIAMWVSRNRGATWTMTRQLTVNSPYNHTYARRPVNAHQDFYAFWADGHGREMSKSRLYFCDRSGENVYMLPEQMTADFEKPISVARAAAPNDRSMQRADGYRGIWHADMASEDEYRYIYYSGGMGTYTAKHLPMAYYDNVANKTFFCYGGTSSDGSTLLPMLSYYDHTTGTVPRPLIIMDKKTGDAHDNPAIMMDDGGFLWLFISAHGRARHAYIYRSAAPRAIDSFELISETNFSYPQPWYIEDNGFFFFHTRYIDGRNLYWMTSPDGVGWTAPKKLAAIGQGHYQVSWRHGTKVGTAFNYHPDLNEGGNWDDPENPGKNPAKSGANNRTNLYYIATDDFGKTWRNAAGKTLDVPLTEPDNDGLVRDFRRDGLLVYMKDLNFTADGRPVILYLTSRGSESGPENGPRTWMTSCWTGDKWRTTPVTTSDNNYDMGSLIVETDGVWSIIAPTGTGPQAYNSGGEMVLWTSRDEGVSWQETRPVTTDSEFNHSYARRPVNAHPDFAAFWTDGNGRAPSQSRIYMSDKSGESVFRLPERMTSDREKPRPYSGR
ncbi:BNR-4 repeat-containing protein [Candidatus Latescibacterota bacterium]